MNPLRSIDKILNAITMYRVVLYGLTLIAIASLILSVSGALGFTSISLLALLGLLVITCAPLNFILSKVFKVPFAYEPTAITVLILYMILPPVTNITEALVTSVAGIAAVASKYLITARGRHIFNPAAFGLGVVVIAGLSSSMWWVGSIYMLPFTLLVGLAVLRKTRRFTMFAIFTSVALTITLITGLIDGRSASDILRLAIVSSPLVFAGTIMLTEPATMPTSYRNRMLFAGLVAVLFVAPVSFGPISSTPEVALLAGNLFAAAVSPASQLKLRLIRKRKMSHNVYDYEFENLSRKPHRFEAGQYAEITLPLKQSDNRGNRRTFTIASAPTENTVHFGFKFYQPSSRFKIALHDLQIGDIVHANHINGDFTLPRDSSRKLVFIAGGIGITPFRAHLMQLLHTDNRRDICLFYLTSSPEEISYRDELQKAADDLGIRIVTLSGTKAKAQLNTKLLKSELGNYTDSIFYVSGPTSMVEDTTKMLRLSGVKSANIRTDHFSGY